MITLLTGLLGVFSSALPRLLGFIQTWQDHRHELAMTTLQIQAQRELAAQRLEEVRVQADAAEQAALSAEQVELIKAQARPSGIRWVDAISSLVRPVVTLLFMLDYLLIKLAQFTLLWGSGIEWQSAVGQMWSETDGAIFMAVITFWFGERSFRRQMQG